MTEDEKKQIDSMSHYELAYRWRFSKCGDPLFQGDTGEYFKKALFDDKGGFTPELSKSIGW